MTPETTPAPRTHMPALDGVRGLAVAAVLLYHFGLPHTRGGWVGVDLFFVLSGFLITGLLTGEHAATGRIALRAFWLRRARRLGPALLAFLLVAGIIRVVAGLAIGSWSVQTAPLGLLESAVATATFTLNWLAAHSVAVPNGHLWSLSVEEQFYLAWPPLLALAAGRRKVAAAALALVAAGSAMATLLLWAGGASVDRLYYATDTRVVGLAVGGLLGLAFTSGRLHRLPAPVVTGVGLLGGCVLLTVVTTNLPTWSPLCFTGGYALFAASGGGLVVWAALRGPALLRVAPLRWLGRRSYALYLWHAPIAVWLAGRGPLATLCGIALSMAAAELSWRLVESRLQRSPVPR